MTEQEQIKEAQDEARDDSRTSNSGYIPLPRITGKFNYMTINGNDYSVLFIPFKTDATVIIARDLTFYEAADLIDALNYECDITREEIENRANVMYLKRRANKRK